MSSELIAVAVIDLGDFESTSDEQHVSRFASRNLGGEPLVTRMARRLDSCILVDRVYVVGSNIPTGVMTSGIAGPETINLPSCHACERLCAVVDRTRADWIVAVPGNRPFIDPGLIDHLLARALKTKECDYVGYVSSMDDGQRASQLGLVGEACHGDTLRRMRRNSICLTKSLGASIPSWLENAPGAYHLKFVPLPAELDRPDLRFSVEDEMDWEDVQRLCETVSKRDAVWSEVASVAMSDARIRASMKRRNA